MSPVQSMLLSFMLLKGGQFRVLRMLRTAAGELIQLSLWLRRYIW